jgi:hypothetical protein
MNLTKKNEWHKSRIYGSDPDEAPDKVFDRVSLLLPAKRNDALPIYVEDNPAKDDFFPLETNEIAEIVSKSIAPESRDLTHVWLRRPKPSEFRGGRIPFTEYFYANDICLMVFYPWPKNLIFPLTKKPTDAILNRYRKWSPKVSSHKGKWQLQWTENSVHDFYVNDLLRNLLALHTDFHTKLAQMPERRLRNGNLVQYANQRFFEQTQSYS